MVSRPIPVNPAGLQAGPRFDAMAYVPVWDVRQHVQAPLRDAPQQPAAPPLRPVPEVSWPMSGVALLAVSGLSGVLAVVSSLGLWPPVAADHMGLDNRGAFYLFVAGLFLLSSALYAAWRTRLLRNLDQAQWDARLMAYANMGAGGLISAALALLALAVVAAILILAGIVVLLLSGAGGQPFE